MLRLRTFGGLSVEIEGRAMGGAWAQRKRLALLALLAAARDRGVSRDKLLAYLWPETDVERARHTLAQMLYAMRRELRGESIVLGTAELRLNPQCLASDVREFEEALDRGERLSAVARYTGAFLDGFHLHEAPEFERWVEDERARLAHRFRGAAYTVAVEADARQDRELAIEAWRRLAAFEPLDGRATLGLMLALVAAGDRSGALKQARIHEALIRAELDTAPDESVLALAERLRGEAARRRPPPSIEKGAGANGPLVIPEVPARAERSRPAALPPSPDSPPTQPSPPPQITGERRRWELVVVGALVAIGFLLMTTVAVVSRPVPPVMAVGYIEDYAHDSGGLARPLADMLATNLARVPGLQVIGNARMYEVLGQLGVGEPSGVAMAQAARRAGATELIEGALYRAANGSLRFEVRRVELESGGLLGVSIVQGADPITLVERATTRLAEGLDVRISPLRISDVTTKSLVAYRFYEEGLRAYYQSDGAGARRLFLAAIAEDSAFALAMYYAALTEIALGTPSSGYERLTRAARLAEHASDRERLLIRAAWAAEVVDPSARAVAETLAMRYPAEPDGHYLLGHAKVWAGDYLGALPHLQRVLQIDSLSLQQQGASARCRACDAYSEIINLYLLADSLPAAERTVRQLLRLQPQSAGALDELARVLAYGDRFDEARAVRHRRWQTSSPPADDAVFSVMLALRAGEYQAADRILDALRRDASETVERAALWWVIYSLRAQGRLREALEASRRFRELSARLSPPSRGPPYDALYEAHVLFERGQLHESVSLFDSLAVPPDFEPVYAGRIARQRTWILTHLATAVAAAGDTTRLAAISDTLAMVGPRSGYGRDHRLHHYARGLLLMRRGRLEEAAAELRRSIVSSTAGYTRASYELGRLLIQLDRPEQAVAILQPALRGPLDASNLYVTRTELQELLAQAHDAAGARDSAATYYRKVMRAWLGADPEFRSRQRAAQQRLIELERIGRQGRTST